jgi:uncharacterized protein
VARLTVRVHPRASRSRLQLNADKSVEIWTTAPAIAGKANDAITRLLAEHLGVPAGSVSIVGPAHARIKQFDVAGLDLDQVLTRLAAGSSS